MTPQQVEQTAIRLKQAVAGQDEDAVLDSAVELLIGAALNLAKLAHPTGEPS